jgi:hypothetical protein
MSDTSAAVISADVGMTLKAVLVQATAERVMNAADHEPPFPGELTAGFPGKSKAPTGALMVSAKGVVIGVLLAVALGKEKRGGDKMAGFPDGLGAMSGVEGAFRCFLLVFVGNA